MRSRSWIFVWLGVALALPGCIFVLGDPPYEDDGMYEFDRHENDPDQYQGDDEAYAGELIETEEDDLHRHASHGAGSGNRDRLVVGSAETVGPFSEGILSGPFFFASGQIPRHPETGEVVRHDAELGTRLVLEGLRDTLAEAGLGLEDVVKVSVFLKNIDDYAKMNRVYSSFFAEDPPARSTVAVAGLALDAVLEIDLIAIRR